MSDSDDKKVQKFIYIPYHTTEEFHNDDSQIRGILGPVGSSKSSACCAELRFRAGDQEPDANGWRRTSWLVTRASYPSLVSTTITTWKQWMPMARVKMTPPMVWHWRQENAGTDKDGKPDGTHIDMEVQFMSVSDLLADDRKVRSLNITGVWVNEAQEIEDRGLIDILFSRCGRFPDPQVAPLTWSGLIMDANAMDTDHWWYECAETRQAAGWKFFRQPPAVIKKVDDAEIAKIKAGDPKQWREGSNGIWIINPECENLKGQPKHEQYWLDLIPNKHESWIRLNLCAEYGRSAEGRPVYVEFDEQRHVAKEELKPIPGLPLQLGFDTAMMPCAAICQITPQGQLRIIDECSGKSMGMRKFLIEHLKPLLAYKYAGIPLSGVIEPSANIRAASDESTAIGEIKAQGLECTLAPTNLFKPRRDAVASFMTKRVYSTITGKAFEEGLIISPNCAMLLKGFRGNYKLQRVKIDGKDEYKAEAVKNECSHLQDGLQALAVAYDRPRIDAEARNRMRNGSGEPFKIGYATDFPSI